MLWSKFLFFLRVRVFSSSGLFSGLWAVVGAVCGGLNPPLYVSVLGAQMDAGVAAAALAAAAHAQATARCGSESALALAWETCGLQPFLQQRLWPFPSAAARPLACFAAPFELGSEGAFSGGGGGSSDPLENSVPGSYAAGSAGDALSRIYEIKTIVQAGEEQ